MVGCCDQMLFLQRIFFRFRLLFALFFLNSGTVLVSLSMAQAKLFSFTKRSDVKTPCDVKKIMTVVVTSLLLVGLHRSLVHLWVQAYLCTKSVPKKDSSGFIKIFPEIFFSYPRRKSSGKAKKLYYTRCFIISEFLLTEEYLVTTKKACGREFFSPLSHAMFLLSEYIIGGEHCTDWYPKRVAQVG